MISSLIPRDFILRYREHIKLNSLLLHFLYLRSNMSNIQNGISRNKLSVRTFTYTFRVGKLRYSR